MTPLTPRELPRSFPGGGLRRHGGKTRITRSSAASECSLHVPRPLFTLPLFPLFMRSREMWAPHHLRRHRAGPPTPSSLLLVFWMFPDCFPAFRMSRLPDVPRPAQGLRSSLRGNARRSRLPPVRDEAGRHAVTLEDSTAGRAEAGALSEKLVEKLVAPTTCARDRTPYYKILS